MLASRILVVALTCAVTSGAVAQDSARALPIRLDTVRVTAASRAPDRMLTAPAAVDVVPAAAAAKLSITGQAPLALGRISGLDIVQVGATDFNVNARGFNTFVARRVLVLQDGRDLSNALVGAQNWATLSQPLEDLSRIEVVRGPSSALYGANAYNGVINISTPSARDVIGTKLTVGAGERGTLRGDLRQAAMVGDRIGYRVNLGYTQTQDWVRSRTRKDRADWLDEYAPSFGATPTDTNADKVALIGQTIDPVTRSSLGTPDPVRERYGSAMVDYYANNGATLTLESGTAMTDNTVFLNGTGRNQSPHLRRPWARLAWGGRGTDILAWYSGLSSSAVSLNSAQRTENHENVMHVEARNTRTFRGGAGRVIVGSSVAQKGVDTRGTQLGADDDRHDRFYGAFGSVEYGVGRLRTLGALRWDDNDLYPMQISPKIGLVFTPSADHSLHLIFDRAYHIPPLNTVFGVRAFATGKVDLRNDENRLRADPVIGPMLANVVPGTLFTNSIAVPESTYGNRHLRPQRITGYELGYRGTFRRRLFVTMDAYRGRVNDFNTSNLAAAYTGLNPDYPAWTSPNEVSPADRAAVDSAVRSVLATKPTVQNGLTRLADGTTVVATSFGNAGNVDEWGVDLGGSVAIGGSVTVSGSYSWYDFAVRHTIAGSQMVANTPRNKGSVALDYTGRRLDCSLDARLVEGFAWVAGTWIGSVPSSQTVNVYGGYRINPHLRAFTSATDLLDQRRFQVYGGAVIGRRVLVGVTAMR